MSVRRSLARTNAAIAVAVTADGVRTPVSVARLARVARLVLRAEGERSAMLSITLLGDDAMAALNARHLGHRGATDVISFRFRRQRDAPLVGDVYVAPGVARTNAKAAGVGVREEIARLVVHGVLHVLGYDHPADARRELSPMWRRQEVLVRRARRMLAP